FFAPASISTWGLWPASLVSNSREQSALGSRALPDSAGKPMEERSRAEGGLMLDSSIEILTTPHRDDLARLRIANGSGLSVSVLPTGAIFAIEHTEANRRIVVNQTLALPIGDGMARLYLRTGGERPTTL